MKTEYFYIEVDGTKYHCRHECMKDNQTREKQIERGVDFNKNLKDSIREYEKQNPTGSGMIPYNNFECGIYYTKLKSYEDLTHEERELVLFIENFEPVYNTVIPKPNMHRINEAVAEYKRQYANSEDKIFTTQNRVNVINYLKSRKDN